MPRLRLTCLILSGLLLSACASEPPGSSQTPVSAPVPSGSPAAPSLSQEPAWPTATPEERLFLARYVQTLKWIVVADEGAALGQETLRAGVSQANRYLLGKGRSLVDQRTADKVTAELRRAGKLSSGEATNGIQWIAESAGASLVVQVSGTGTTPPSTSGFQAKVQTVLKVSDPNTGDLLAEVPYSSPLCFSQVSSADALSTALQYAVWQSMPTLVETTTKRFEQTLQRGIPYRIALQGTTRAGVVHELERKLDALLEEGTLKDFQIVNSTTDASGRPQSNYEVSAMLRLPQLQVLLEKVADSVPGLERMHSVFTRGNLLVYDTGLEVDVVR